MAITNISVFRSTDGGVTQAGATTGRMSGTAGDRIGLLNMLLLIGYNWQELTPANLTQTGNVATVNQVGHGFNLYQRLWIVGMDQQGYLNSLTYGDAVYPASVADSSHFTFPVTGSPVSPATAGGSTTLGAAVTTTSATSITLTSGASFPNFPYVIKIDSEYMLVTAGFQTTTPTVLRGMFGSTAATHTNSTAVAQKIMVGVAPAGGFNHWTADYTATNKSTYRPPAGNRMWFDVDDTGTTSSSGTAQYANVRGYETMSAEGVGTGMFPLLTSVTVSNGSINCLSGANTTAHPWAVIASDRMLHMWVDCAATVVNQTYSSTFSFTDLINQTKSGDAYATLMIFSNPSYTSDYGFAQMSTSTCTAHWMPRSFTQLGSPINVGKTPKDGRAANNNSGTGPMTFPHPPDGGLYLSPISVNEGSSTLTRGDIPGLWDVMHVRPCQTFDIIQGTGAFAGKTFLMLCTYSVAQIAFEISNTIQAT